MITLHKRQGQSPHTHSHHARSREKCQGQAYRGTAVARDRVQGPEGIHCTSEIHPLVPYALVGQSTEAQMPSVFPIGSLYSCSSGKKTALFQFFVFWR